jgi:hypothetical protein
VIYSILDVLVLFIFRVKTYLKLSCPSHDSQVLYVRIGKAFEIIRVKKYLKLSCPSHDSQILYVRIGKVSGFEYRTNTKLLASFQCSFCKGIF